MAVRSNAEIFARYLDGERIVVIPSRRRREMLVLEWLVQRFEFAVDDTEAE